MRFASLGGSNAASYAAAGKSVADSAVKSFAVQRKAGPDFGMLSEVAMKTASNERIAGMKAAANVTKVGIGVYSDNKQLANNINASEKIRDIINSQRKAGGLAAIGKIAGAGYLAATDNTKGRERPKADLRGLYDSYQTKRDALKAQQASERDAIGTFESPTFTPPDRNYGKATKGTETIPLVGSLTGNQKTVADAVAKYESGDWGYEAFNQGGAAGGTKVLGKSGSYKNTYGSSLTDMTLGQIYHKQNTKQRGLSMDEHINSGGLHAVGRYQFIGPTLQDEARRMGLSDDTKFTPQVQDSIFLSHIKRAGNISPWVGPSNNYNSSQKSQFNQMIAGF